MESRDGQVPTPRRPVPAPADRAGRGPERAPELAALLRDLDGLRTTLTTDLSLAAAALEAGADDVAVELVDGDLAAVRGFSARADGRLAALAAAASTPVAESPTLEPSIHEPSAPVAALRPRRRRLMSAGPLVAAAAALLGFAAGVVPDRAAPQPATSLTSATMASDELYRLISLGAPDEALREAAEEVNAELAELLVEAQDDPAAAQRALVLLDSTTSVLAGQGDSSVLRAVMVEARALRARLRAGLPALAEVPLRPVPLPSLPAPVPPRSVDQPAAAEPTPAASTQPAPDADADTDADTDTEPTSSPTPAPQPQPAGEPQPSGDAEPQPGAEFLQPGLGF